MSSLPKINQVITKTNPAIFSEWSDRVLPSEIRGWNKRTLRQTGTLGNYFQSPPDCVVRWNEQAGLHVVLKMKMRKNPGKRKITSRKIGSFSDNPEKLPASAPLIIPQHGEMRRRPALSEALSSAGYDPQKQVLEAEFVHGGVYQYFNVPRRVWWRFLLAPSKGSFFACEIRGQYPFRKL